ncbi:MAG: thioesterase family protein [Bacillota bacterium]|nr:thioesterase family protein [Bacillota bacterium]
MKSFIYERAVQYHETDQMKFVHHSNYIKWFEEARTAFLSDLGFGYDKMESMGVISPVVSISCEYKSPSKYGETVCVETKIKEYTGVKVVFSYTVTGKADSKIKATGESKHCFLSKDSKVVSVKKDLPEIDKLIRDCMDITEH